MKQTNNAIKFLMAQYRAIYQSAYLKGLASAIIVTASLAAGQAQAADLTSFDGLKSDETITIPGNYDKITITTNATTNDTAEFKVQITSAKGVENKVAGVAASAKKATFEINGADTTLKVAATAAAPGGTPAAAAGSLTIGTLDIKKGLVTIDAEAKDASLVADQVNVASGGKITVSSIGTGQASLGNETTKYKLESGSTITLGSSGAMLGQSIVSNSGKIVLSSGTLQTPTYFQNSATKTAQKLDLDVSATSTIALANSGDSLGVLDLASGSTIDIKAATTGQAANELKITDNGTKGSIVVLQDGVSLKSSLATGNTVGGVISVSGAAASKSELHITAKTLGEFLAPTDNAKNTKGSILLDANSTLKFTNDSSVDIAASATKSDGSELQIVSGNAGVAGQVVISGAATIDGKKITISKAMANGLETKLSVTADELTLGSSSNQNTGPLGVASLTAKNVKFVGSGSSTFVLADKLTLSNLADDATDPAKKVAQKGTIAGPVIISGTGTKATTVDGGLYTSTGDITISGGTVNVHNNKNADQSSLTADGGNWILDRAAAGTINVSGTSTLLDLSKATVKYKDPATATANVTFQAQSGGEIKLKGEDIATLLGDGQTSGAVFEIDSSGSQLTAAGDLTLKDDALIMSSAATTPKAAIILKNGATLAAEGTLELQKFETTGLTLASAKTTLQAGTLKLTLEEANASSNSAILKSGHYVVTAGLDTNAKNGVVVSGSDAKFDFGGLKKDADNKYTALSSGGSTDEAIVVSGAKMNVNAGTWNLTGKLTLNGSSPSLTVGNADTILTSAGGTITATLNASELDIQAGTVTVEKTGILNLQKVNAITNSITINTTNDSGSILAGAFDDSKTDAYDKYGIKLADDAITVNEGAFLTLKGAGVEAALGAVYSGDKVTGFDIKKNGAFDSGGSLVSKAGSTVNITYFKDGTVFTKEALKQLSDGLFGTDKTQLAGSINLGKVVFDGLQSSGGTVSWTDAKDFGVNYLPHYKNDDLMSAQLINVSGDTVYGHWGSVLDTTQTSGGKVSFADNASLNNAKEIDGKKYFALGKDNAVLGLEIKSGGTLTLANGGIAGAVTIGDKATLNVDSKSGYTTELESISGGDTAKVQLTSGITQVNKNIKVGQMSSEAESILNVTGNLTLTNNDKASEFKGIVNVSKDKNKSGGNVVLSGTTTFAGTTNVEGDFTSKKEVTFTGNATIEGLTKFTGKATVEGGGFLKAKDIELGNTTTLYIGREILKEGSGDKAKYESSTGYLEAERVDLNGGTLFIDPEYGKATSIAVIKRFGDKPTGADPNKDPVDVGNINGKLIIGQNSALFAGSDASVELMKTFIKRYQESTGTSLTKENGSILYVSDKLTVDSNSRIILDAEAHQNAIETELNKSKDGKYAAAYNGASTKTNADLFLGKGSVLVVGQDTLDEGSAIYFEKKDASILAEGGSKVVLDGDRFISSRDIIIFQDSGNDGINILGEKGKNDIKVESINGIMGFTMEAGKTTSGGTLELLTDKIDSAYRGASTPMRDYLIGYASLTKNWQEYYSNTDENADSSINPKVDRDYFVERAADKSIATADAKGNITVHDKKYNASQFVAVKQADGSYQVFFKAYNEFLEKVIRDTNGLAADQAARMGVFGGSADAAMLVGNASYEAVAGRFGMGQQGMLMTYANNGQGGAMWVAPVYKSRETNGFKAQGLEYGSDTSITGLVLGADLTYEDGMRYGVMANIGEGDSSGEGAAKGVSSEYKYYSFGFYAGYNYKAFSMVGDLSYSVVDSDVDANTDAGMVNTSFNTTNLSVGVTGQVNLSYRGLDIVPHAGLRYSMIDMDDYDMSGNGKIGSVSVDKVNVMSVPVGVTISKEYFSEEWSFQPSIDLNLTANFGDDKIDGNVKWSGISNADLNTSNEFMDDLTYGVIFGFGAQSERLSIGAGLGYQGSSNVDEFTLTGTARYTF